MSHLSRRSLVKWLEGHDFEALPGTATSHRHFRHPSGVVVTVSDHGRKELSKKHAGMIVRQLERAGFDRGSVRGELGI